MLATYTLLVQQFGWMYYITSGVAMLLTSVIVCKCVSYRLQEKIDKKKQTTECVFFRINKHASGSCYGKCPLPSILKPNVNVIPAVCYTHLLESAVRCLNFNIWPWESSVSKQSSPSHIIRLILSTGQIVVQSYNAMLQFASKCSVMLVVCRV